MLTINIIGAGRLGKTLAKLIHLHDAAIIQGVCNASMQSSLAAIAFIGAGTAYADIADLPPADITLITTPDEKIKTCAEALANSKNLKSASCIVHCSGALNSEILATVKTKLCNVVSLHPMRSFSNPDLSVAQYKNTLCALEGDAAAINVIHELFTKIGSIVYLIGSDKKEMYHIAGVYASNYLVTLFQKSLDCLAVAGVDNNTAVEVVENLMQSTLDNLKNTRSASEALTGPIKRGDVATIAKHVAVLSDSDLNRLYKQLALVTLDLAELPKDIEKEIRKLLL